MTKLDLSSINKKYVKIDTKPNIDKNKKDVKIYTKKDDKHIENLIKEIKKDKKDKIEKDVLSNIKLEDKKPELSDLDRSKKIKLLELYLIEFPDKLDKYKNENFYKKTDEELIELKKIFEKSVSSTNNLNFGVSISQQALAIYEYIGKLGGLEIDGISKLGQSEEWVKNIKALSLKYMDGGITFIEPEHKLIFMLFQNTLMLHYINTTEKPLQQDNKVSLSQVSSIEKKLRVNDISSSYNDL